MHGRLHVSSMWTVKKVRLIVLIVLTVLLTSFFLLVQMCMLESSCYNGLSEMAASHRKFFKSLTTRGQLHLSAYEESHHEVVLQNGLESTRSSLGQRKLINEVMNQADHNLDGMTVHYTAATNEQSKQNSNLSEFEELIQTLTTNAASTTAQPSVEQAERAVSPNLPENTIGQLTHAATPQVKYRQIPKSAITMLQFSHGGNPTSLCKQPHCTEYFSNIDKACDDYCVKKQRKNSKGRKSMAIRDSGMHGECRFMRGEGRAAVALVSLPGSGSTWIRGLLEKATGICTGAVYCDVHLKNAGFNGEAMRSGSVLLVKTHKANVSWTDMNKPEFTPKGTPSYGAVILLLRNPYHAMVAEWNRKEARIQKKKSEPPNTTTTTTSLPLEDEDTFISHTGSVGPEHFGTNPAWNAFIHKMMMKWLSYVVNLILKAPPGRPKLVVRYEDFQRDRVREVSRILDFLYFPYTPATLAERLKEDFDSFQRKRHGEFEAFTESQEQYVEQQLRGLLDRLRRDSNTFGIEEYLRSDSLL